MLLILYIILQMNKAKIGWKLLCVNLTDNVNKYSKMEGQEKDLFSLVHKNNLSGLG